jgi:hypothetical protein
MAGVKPNDPDSDACHNDSLRRRYVTFAARECTFGTSMRRHIASIH